METKPPPSDATHLSPPSITVAVTLSVRIVFALSEPPAKLFCTKMFLHSRSPSQCSPQGQSRMLWICLADSHHQNRTCCWLSKILLKKGLQQCRKPLSLESQDCTVISKTVFYISQYSWETAHGKRKKRGNCCALQVFMPFLSPQLGNSGNRDFFCCC